MGETLWQVEQRRVTEFSPGERGQVHLVRAAEDAHRAVPAVHRRQRCGVRDPGRAVDLDGAVDDRADRAGYGDLGGRDQVTRLLVAGRVDDVGRSVTEGPGLLELDPRLGDALAHRG